LKSNYFEDTAKNENKIIHFDAKSDEFLSFILGTTGVALRDIQNSIAIIDESDVYAGIDRLLIKHYLRFNDENE
jgi:hypothetical protein